MRPAARALSVSYTSGTDDLELLGELRTYQTLLSGYGADSPFEYVIESLVEDAWEEGVGRLTAGSPPVLQRLVVTASSNAGELVDFIAGEKRVFGTFGTLSCAAAMLIKTPARVVATANVNITSGLNAGDVIDGVTLTTDDRVLLTAQTDPVQNGLWQVTGAGAAVRTADMLADDLASGSIVSIIEGSAGAASQYLCSSTAGNDVVGTDELTWTLLFPDHTHSIADVDGLQDALDAKVPSSGLNELIDDRVSNLLVAGTDISLSYNDAAGTLTINSTADGGGGSSLPVNDTTSLVRDPADNTRQLRIDVGAVATGTTRAWTAPDQDLDFNPAGGTFAGSGHTHIIDNVTGLQDALDAKVSSSGLNELIDDQVASLLVAGTNVSLTYDDGAGTLTIDATAGGGGSDLTYVLRNTGTSYSVAANTDLFVANASNFTVLFPASPTDGDRIRVTKLLVNTNWVALDLQGQTLGNGTTSIIYLRSYGATADLVFRNGGWNYLVNGTGVKATSTELTAGTETEIRSYSPADLKSIISTNGGLLSTTVKTSAYTAAAGEIVFVDPSAATADIPITLPATAADCAVMLTTNAAGPWRVSIGRNGNTVNGLTSTDNLSMSRAGQLLMVRRVASGAYSAQRHSPSQESQAIRFISLIAGYYTVANHSSINLTGSLSIGCWFRTTNAGERYIYGGLNMSVPAQGYALSLNGGLFRFWDGAAWRTTGSNETFNDGAWHLGVATYETGSPNGTVNLYIDGFLVETITSAASSLTSNTTAKAIGAASSGAAQWDGGLQHVFIVNGVLSQADNTTLWRNGRGDVTWLLATKPAAWWPMNEGAGSSTLADLSGNANTATKTGTVFTTTGHVGLFQ